MVRFALDGHQSQPATRALMVGYLARQAAMAHYGRLHAGAASPTLSGKDAAGRHLRQNHRHAHYFAADEDQDGYLDRLTVWAPAGLTAAELAALSRLEWLKQPNEPPVGLRWLGQGEVMDMPGFLAGPARRWRSASPFVLPRHPKWRGPAGEKRLVDGPEDQLRQELAERGLGAALVEVRPAPAWRVAGEERSWAEFRRSRPGSRPAVSAAFGFELVFAAPVWGPVAAGFGAHFGLGLFTPVWE